mmetsp:Transcript_27030/g.41463  ORF Transcript_27030/g.41463 Transcript_27030/m.41463 type:complete len:83 (-) Transcript_27030:1472-1720(-)
MSWIRFSTFSHAGINRDRDGQRTQQRHLSRSEITPFLKNFPCGVQHMNFTKPPKGDRCDDTILQCPSFSFLSLPFMSSEGQW